ncbi:hypothetical protein ACFQGW_13275 [Xanthomonas theicola]|uniref:hypothetical protein n=1 Tax=Xanthomonas theicola TaxID=56464 RepID=UPI001639A3DE|nr:hypothetical protein [Xanthomonas theicola]QNH26318.1 hypothetical protein G4Q83_18495 [Xanthomonas theicola]
MGDGALRGVGMVALGPPAAHTVHRHRGTAAARGPAHPQAAYNRRLRITGGCR